MGNVRGAMPNMFGGITQQPPEVRPLNTFSDVLNGIPSVVSGLRKRPSTSFVSILQTGTLSTSVGSHLLERATKNDKMLIASNGSLKVFDLATGAEEPVTISGSGVTYVNTLDPEGDLGFLSVGDTVFIYNKAVNVQATGVAETGDRLDPDLYATAWIRQQALGVNYNLYINGSLTATTYDDTSPTKGTDTFAAELRSHLVSNGFTTYQNGSVVTFQVSSSQVLTSTDGYGDQAIRSYNEVIERFSDLPPSESNGRVVRIQGSADDDTEGYFVRFENGIWSEVVGFDAKEELDASTMPHKLIDNGDGTWELLAHEWDPRGSGDTDTNPTPSFVGHPINHLFIYKGRMCILADENFIASQKDNFEGFYRKTLTQLLDDDRIDIASSEGYMHLAYAVELNEKLLISSDRDQMILSYGDTFSPNSVKLERTTGYEF
ncbi:MAG: hypothetical protein JKY10_06840, partial [Cohaesibacteraceae bacterium]|nr:hypothetical protein [Cohaesibacteraceae bacterium]